MIPKIFIDTNVAMDLLSERKPFHEFAHKIFFLAAYNKIKIFISSLSFSTIDYLLSKEIGAKKSIEALRELKSNVTVLPIDDKTIDSALYSNFKDFEDAIQYYCAIENGIKTIVTRDGKDFKNAGVMVLTPEEYLRSL